MSDYISREAAIDALDKRFDSIPMEQTTEILLLRKDLRDLPPVQPERLTDDDFETIRIHLNAFKEELCNQRRWKEAGEYQRIIERFMAFASAQPEQRYTEEELRVFQHGISLSLLSKRSSQHWQYDEDTATEIKFLERLYEKVGADIRSEHDG